MESELIMNVTGIIAEYNPFHKGHQYQIDYVRKQLKADYIVVVMSGDYVQRGAPALLPKHLRAKMALNGGADLVLELPVQSSAASAEFFAQGAVSLLDGIGAVTHLCFGSEEGEISGMLSAARILNEEPKEYQEALRHFLCEGYSFPYARNQAFLRYSKSIPSSAGTEEITRLFSSPNNILGIEYCRSLLKRNSSIEPVTLKREGSGYHEKDLIPRQAPSASAIRSFLCRAGQLSDCDVLNDMIPESSLSLLLKALKTNGFLTEKDFDLLLHYRLLTLSPDEMKGFQEISSKLAQRIRKRLNEYEGFSQFAGLLKTKEITRTRIQRGLLHLLLGVQSSAREIPYARVLGFRRAASPLLKEIKKRGEIPLITKAANAPALLSADALRFMETNTTASNIYESILCKKEGRAFIHEYQKPIVIAENHPRYIPD